MFDPKAIQTGSVVRYVMHDVDYGKEAVSRGPKVRPAIVLTPPAVPSAGVKPDTRAEIVVLCSGLEDGIPSNTLHRAAVQHSGDEIPGTYHVASDIAPPPVK